MPYWRFSPIVLEPLALAGLTKIGHAHRAYGADCECERFAPLLTLLPGRKRRSIGPPVGES